MTAIQSTLDSVTKLIDGKSPTNAPDLSTIISRNNLLYGDAEFFNGWIKLDYLINENPTATSAATAPGQDWTFTGNQLDKLDYKNRVKFTQHGVLKYGHIVGKSYGSNTVFNILINNDYTVESTSSYPITNVYISRESTPKGFDSNPEKYSIELVDATDHYMTGGSLVAGTYTVINQITLTTGLWWLSYSCSNYVVGGGIGNNIYSKVGIGEDGTAFSIPKLTANSFLSESYDGGVQSGQRQGISMPTYRRTLFLSGYHTYYFLWFCGMYGCNTGGIIGSDIPLVITATSAYL